MSKKRKTGRFSLSELNYLKQHAEIKTVQELARKLNRDPLSIDKWIKRNVGLTQVEKKEVEGTSELRKREYYKELQNQFTDQELELFELHFKKMWVQFKDDVFHTEEMQIVDAIKYEILMNRVLKNQRSASAQIETLEREVQLLREIEPDCLTRDDRDNILNLERQISAIRSSLEIMGKEFKEYQQRKGVLIKELKGTREQRIKDIESSKQSFATLVKRLTTDPAYRHSVGLEMEIMRHAADAEWKRLAEPMQYNDGVTDRPLLSAESVVLNEE